MKAKTIKQTVTFKATSPHEVYEALMDSRKHSEFTGSKANISRTVGGKITAYDGYIEGKNLELVKDRKIVQSWRSTDWPEGHHSTATFELEALKGGKGCKLTFTQTDVPAEQSKDIAQGWKDFYWKPMKGMLEGKAGD